MPNEQYTTDRHGTNPHSTLGNIMASTPDFARKENTLGSLLRAGAGFFAAVMAFYALAGCEKNDQEREPVKPPVATRSFEDKLYPNELAPKYGVIGDNTIWNQMWDRQALNFLPSIDFKNQMVVIYNSRRQGKPKEGKVTVSIDSIVETEETLIVK